MTKIMILRKELMNFLAFTKDIPDLRLVCAGVRITAEIAYSSYYLKKTLTVTPETIIDEGTIHIVYLDKFKQFLKASKNDYITVRQIAITKPLYVSSGANKFQIPSSDDIESATKVPIIRTMLTKGEESEWCNVGSVTLTHHTKIESTDLKSLADMKSLVSKESSFKIKVTPERWGLIAGQTINGKLTTELPIKNTSDEADDVIDSNFGEWLPNCLQYLDDDDVTVHMGQNTLAVFAQANTLLMVVDLAVD
jgi:hypothetical protein